jgi:membrane-associated protein
MHNLLDPSHLVKDFGYVGLFITVFLESGVIIGFFLPGDSLLFTAGLLASQHQVNIVAIILLAVTAAILGNNVGYYTGKKTGHTLFNRPKSWIFSPHRVKEAHVFFEREGGQALILARFIPAVRTFVPIIAGVGNMPYRRFFTFNALGGLLWGILLPTLGYTLGKTVPSIDKYLLPAVLLIIVLSALPVLFHYQKSKGVKNG